MLYCCEKFEIKMLKNIAQMSLGHLFRAKPDYVESGGYPVILMKDVLPSEDIDWSKLVRVRLDEVKDGSFARRGDVLLKSKGVSHLATCVAEPLEDTVVSAQLVIIRVEADNILPEYLAWYINQIPAQQYIEKHSVGTNIRHLSINKIADLPINVPSLKVQETIVALCKLHKREKQIVEQIQGLREKLITATMLRKIEETINVS